MQVDAVNAYLGDTIAKMEHKNAKFPKIIETKAGRIPGN